MSDDDEYYDDEFDGDWLWFDDGERELADDLAEGTTHSPVYLDQGAYDAIDSASDWDYYTDEYFDDDESLIRKQGLAVTASSGFSTVGRKRKQGEQHSKKTEDHPDSANSFCRILYRASNDHLINQGEIYEPGQGEKVALLKNWREIFKDSQPKRDHRLQKSASGAQPYAKSGRRPGRPRKGEKRDGAKTHAKNSLIAVEVPVFDYQRDSETGSEDGGGKSFTPPPSLLSPTPRGKAGRLSHNSRHEPNSKQRSGSRLKTVIATQEEDTGPTSSASTPPSRASSIRRSGRISSAARPTSLNSQNVGDLNSSEQEDGYEADLAEDFPAEKGNSRTSQHQRRKRKASSPLENTDGKSRSTIRATTRRRLENGDKGTDQAIGAPLTALPARRSLSQRK
ncbi:hypothetical protein AJ79_01829 [Helicocarpus griseus UAMH5409]|uniref:Uncharacterized protein n=1 Tax=Helicocarpus griseus UAMH5409 TaxID=1447875 RepID=A0A2B7Y4Y6_9EURO|nr:hypothetical protein AJ79_01829 [Helicocarpus griseus UAMH5409]